LKELNGRLKKWLHIKSKLARYREACFNDFSFLFFTAIKHFKKIKISGEAEYLKSIKLTLRESVTFLTR